MELEDETFDVAIDALEAAYKRLQRQLHPDKFSISGQEERAYSEEQSSLVNQAYSVLRDPLKRAFYLLERSGRIEPSKGGVEGLATVEDEALLMEIMEARELVDSTEDPGELQRLREENAATAAEQVKELSGAFRSGDLDAALELATKLRYTTRIGEAILLKL